MSRTNTVKILLVAAGLVLATMSGARADDDDHDFAKRALEQGRALPLADIIAKVSPQAPGKVIEVELEDEDGPRSSRHLDPEVALFRLVHDDLDLPFHAPALSARRYAAGHRFRERERERERKTHGRVMVLR
jgi:hypothetical protein